VAEDFAAWDVDVTTEETDDLGNPLVLTNIGARAVIGGKSSDWFGSGAGGVAYVNSFGRAYYEPAFVFPGDLGNGYPKYVWEATSHELGHRLGLSHDGTSTTSCPRSSPQQQAKQNARAALLPLPTRAMVLLFLPSHISTTCY
jgi:hypothetical protein